MRMQDVVAFMLAIAVMTVLLSGTYLRCAFMDCTVPYPAVAQGQEFWKDIILVILGALSGYISGRAAGRNDDYDP